jgi:uncharacterized protein (UPF0335 family)
MAADAALTVRSPHSPPRLDRADAIVELCAGRVDPEETMSGPVGLAGDQLRAFVERIEHVEEEIKALTEDKKDIYAEAKGQGYDVKILREVVGSGSRTRRSRTRTSRCSTPICAPSRQQRRPWRKRREARAGGRLRPPFFVSGQVPFTVPGADAFAPPRYGPEISDDINAQQAGLRFRTRRPPLRPPSHRPST